MNSTQSQQYANYLIDHQKSLKGKVFQIPYQTHLRLLRLGKTLDVGCGAGRNLQTLPKNSVGIDHNPQLVKACQSRGLIAYTTEEWTNKKNEFTASFDSILFSHVAEHMSQIEFQQLLDSMLTLLKPNGRVLIICPQEAGYKTDNTHIEFMDFSKVASVFKNLKLNTEKQYSFPFVRPFGNFFPYNEFISVGRKPG